MKLLAPLLLALSLSTAFAETATYKVSGMHCGGCAKMIEDKVCKMDGVTTCKAKLTNEKKRLGELTLTTAEGAPIDTIKIEQLLDDAGGYKLVKSESKKK